MFCVALPGSQLLADGWPKIVLRRAMADLLPDSVRWRIGKEHLGWSFTLELFRAWKGWQALLATRSAVLARFANTSLTGDSETFNSYGVDKVRKIELYHLGNWLTSAGYMDSSEAKF